MPNVAPYRRAAGYRASEYRRWLAKIFLPERTSFNSSINQSIKSSLRISGELMKLFQFIAWLLITYGAICHILIFCALSDFTCMTIPNKLASNLKASIAINILGIQL